MPGKGFTSILLGLNFMVYEFIRLKVQKTFDVHSYCIYLLLLQLIIRVHVSCNDKWNEKLQRNFKG